jgi:bacteriorhodopsin
MMVSPFDSFVQRNDALEVNPTKAGTDYAITSHGSDVYWAVAAVMSFSTIIFFGLSFTKPRSDRLFHYITGSITMVAAIAYFTMASNLGYTGIAVEFRPSFENQTREIFYVRYIDWFITTPVRVQNDGFI